MEYINLKRKKELKNNQFEWLIWLPLDTEFKQQTERLVSETLQLYKTAGASPRIGDVWKCENTGDFLCGFFVGEMVGSALSAFQVYHKREPTSDEHMEIVDIVETYSNEISEFFSKFNNK